MFLQTEKDMSIHSHALKDNYVISKRDFTDDYSMHDYYATDMSLSGIFLEKRKISHKILKLELDKYPSYKETEKLLKKLAVENDVALGNIVLGNGANGIFQNLIKIFFRTKGNLVTPYLSFSQPEYAVTSFGSETKRVFMKDLFEIDFVALKNAVDEKTKAVFICNPNNPTGIYVDSKKIIDFAADLNIPVILSEASIDFCKKTAVTDYKMPENLITVRSFSKAIGLAGIRLGYAIMSEKYVNLYKKNISQFEISTSTLFFGNKYVCSRQKAKNIEKIIKERIFLETQFKKLHIPYIKSDSNILMSTEYYSESFFKALEKEGVYVVPVNMQNGKTCFRVAVQDHKTNQIFIEKIQKVLGREKNE